MTIMRCYLIALCMSWGVFAGGLSYAQSDQASDLHTLNMTDVGLSVLADDIARLTGYTFVHHPDLQGRATVSSQVPLDRDEIFKVFLSTLRVHGFTAVPSGRGIYRLVPEQVGVGDAARRLENSVGFAVEVFRLDHFDAVEATKIIRPLLGGEGQISASPNSNLLFVVDYGANISRVRDMINELDQDTSTTRTVQLRNVPVEEMSAILNALGLGGGPNENGLSRFLATASPASNSVVLRGDPLIIAKAMDVVRQLDEAPASSKETRMFTLNHTEATAIVPILQEIVSEQSGEGVAASGKVETRIAVHEATNTIIASASPQSMLIIEDIIHELDASRRQVLVEAIIVDVSDDAERELGLQFLVAGEDGNVPFFSSNFSGNAANLLALTGATVSTAGGPGVDPDGTPTTGSADLVQSAIASLIGLQGGAAGIAGSSNGTLFSVILNALQEDDETTVLSTPSVLTLDNRPATISVGQEIPIVSGSALGDANANPFTTVERREIGIILNVIPRIGKDGTIQLNINQEVSSIAAMVGDVTQDFVLNQSQIETNIKAQDGELIVLGGLIQTADQIEIQKVPVLGDIPLVGRAFRNEAVESEKSNLMVFIRPTIIKDNDDAREATARNYNFVRAQQIIANQGRAPAIDQFVSELLDGEVPTDEELVARHSKVRGVLRSRSRKRNANTDASYVPAPVQDTQILDAVPDE